MSPNRGGQSKVQHSSGQEAIPHCGILKLIPFPLFFPPNVIKMVTLICCSFLELTKILKQIKMALVWWSACPQLQLTKGVFVASRV